MNAHFKKAFFAFPGQPSDLYATILTATNASTDSCEKIEVTAWPIFFIHSWAWLDS